jgi:hypothetical protein
LMQAKADKRVPRLHREVSWVVSIMLVRNSGWSWGSGTLSRGAWVMSPPSCGAPQANGTWCRQPREGSGGGATALFFGRARGGLATAIIGADVGQISSG